MHIGIDASQAGFTPRVGIPHYVHHLVGALVRNDRANDYTIFYQHGHGLGINSQPANIRWQPLRSPPSAAAWSQLRLPLALARQTFDVVHVPAHRVPWLVRG